LGLQIGLLFDILLAFDDIDHLLPNGSGWTIKWICWK